MISLRSKLLFNSFSVLGLAALSYSAISYYSLTSMSKQFQALSTNRSEGVKESYLNIFNDNIKKIRSFYEKALLDKGRKLVSHSLATLTPLVADNSIVGVQGYLQRTFEEDREILSAAFFAYEDQEIKAWHYVSTDYPKGLRFPVLYNMKKRGWDAVTFSGKTVFIPDPNILDILKENKAKITYDTNNQNKQNTTKIVFSVPFANGQSAEAVREARKKGRSIGFLRFELTPADMNKAASEEENSLRVVLSALEKRNLGDLRDAQKLTVSSAGTATLFLIIGTLFITGIGYLVSLIISSRMTKPLMRLSSIASEMALGNYNQQISVVTNDEIGVFAKTFQNMSTAIRKRDQELEEINKNLEKLVTIRTEQLKEENRKISSLLNNMQQAVFSVSSDLTVMEPVSRFSEHVFGQSIEGKGIFDFLYCSLNDDLDKLAALKANFFVVFGEGEIQWRLSELSLPRRLKLLKSNSEQIIKISYSPLYNDEGLLETIMLVVEDITKFEKLEKQISAQNKRMEILQQLTTNSIDSLNHYFQNTSASLGKAIQVLRGSSMPISELGPILANLHTIKGNSRSLNLLSLATATHRAEDGIGSVKKGLSPQAEQLESESLIQIRKYIQEIQVCLDEYLEVAKLISGFKNDTRIGYQTELHQALIELGWSYCGVKDSESASKHLELIHSLLLELNGEFNRELNGASSGKELLQTQEAWVPTFIQGLSIIRGTPLFRQQTAQLGIWVIVAEFLFSISQKLDSLEQLSSAQNHQSLFCLTEQAELETFSLGLHGFTEYFKILGDSIKTFIELGIENGKDRAKRFEIALWQHLQNVIQCQVAIQLSRGEKEQFHQQISDLLRTQENLSPSTQKNGNSKHWLIQWTLYLHRTPKRLTSFYDRWAERLQLSLPELLNSFIEGESTWHETFQSFLEGSFLNQGQEKLKQLFLKRSDHNPYLHVLDMLQLVAGSLDEPKFLKDRYRIVEIPEMNINRLRGSFFDETQSTSNSFSIFSAVNQIFEVPLKSALWNFQSLVEQTASKLGKKVHFFVQGEDVMLSKKMVQRISESVLHLLLNAVDHGLENEEERTIRKKQGINQLLLSCAYRNQQVVVCVQDDGRGMDPDRIVAVAVERGVLQVDQISRLTLQEKIEIIFTPGFSTRKEVTELSGRGVGLDAAKQNIESLKGKIDIRSRLGHGTTFEITVPLNFSTKA